jgi:hypothetical protein
MTVSTEALSTDVHGAEAEQPTVAYESLSSGDARGSTVINRKSQNGGIEQSNGIGHLGQKLEVRYIPTSGAAVTRFAVTTNDLFPDQQRQKQECVFMTCSNVGPGSNDNLQNGFQPKAGTIWSKPRLSIATTAA